MVSILKNLKYADAEEAEQIMEELSREASAFAAAHGIVPIRQIRSELIDLMPAHVRAHYLSVREELISLEGVVSKLSCVDRLNILNQLNGKVNPRHLHDDPNSIYAVRPSFHTRFQHSELLAEQSVLSGVVLGLGLRELSLLYCGAMLHDAGHSAFGHAGDELLIRNGRPGHEERSREILQDKEVKLQMKSMCLDVDDIFDVIKERGVLGTLQKIFDTLSYLVLDSGMMFEDLYENSGADVIRSIVGIDDETVVVSDLAPIQQMLDNRAYMAQQIYYGTTGKMIDESIRKLLSISFRRGLLDIEELEHAGDHQLRMKLQSMVQRDPGAAMFGGRYDEQGKLYTDTPLKDCKDLYSMMNGFFNCETWIQYSYSPDELDKIDEFFFRNRNNNKIIEQAFVVGPFDYTKKKLTAKTVDGRMHELKCENIELRPEDRQHILYTPKYC